MITVRQIERLWNANTYPKLLRELLSARPEASLRLEADLQRSTPIAALAMIRLDELSQSYVPLFDRLLRTLLNDQQSDGGWGDPLTTALCLRTLMCDNGQGVAIDRGLTYLANLQKTEGIWPATPIRRMPADPVRLGVHPAATGRQHRLPPIGAICGRGALVRNQYIAVGRRGAKIMGSGHPARRRTGKSAGGSFESHLWS